MEEGPNRRRKQEVAVRKRSAGGKKSSSRSRSSRKSSSSSCSVEPQATGEKTLLSHSQLIFIPAGSFDFAGVYISCRLTEEEQQTEQTERQVKEKVTNQRIKLFLQIFFFNKHF